MDEPGQAPLFGEPGADPPETPPEPDPAAHSQAQPPEPPAPDPEQLQRDLEAAQQREADANRRADEYNDLLMRTIQTPPAAVTPEPEPLGPPPSPIEDPEGFAAWHQRAQQESEARIMRHVNQGRAEQDEAATRSRLWQEFQQEYPEYAGMEKAVQIAFIQATGGRLPADTEKLKRDVKAELDQIRAGFLPGEAGEAAGGDNPPTPPEPNRTAGVGKPSRPAPPPPKRDAEGPVKGLVESLEEMQEKSGFF